ncbi:unnamed protein product [Adineta steineri]|uniref:SAP domain-containing protein n=1 Tax=Adineta steineri TaxID=433720 RepID=A0A814EZ30_9BILA|nr:unnamed protein product [Adineta steineri]CAF0791975.1 unnamed protein product [Adineta steineri]CAF0910900.1 unnamed protein product [Adineta steineri]CAF0978811.1 unnamed protein product [Adineta steineri]
MSDSEEFDSLKVIELQNELKKRGLDTKGRKVDLIERLRQAVNSETEGDTTRQNSMFTDDESVAAVINDDIISSSIVR